MTEVGFDDFTAITRLRYEYAFGIDTCDYELLRSVFTDRIEMDFSSYNGRPAATTTADEWVAGCAQLFDGLDATEHTMTNPIVDLDRNGERARCRMAMQAAHFLGDAPGNEFTIGGWYDDRLVRIDGAWNIEAVTLNVTWRRGNEAIMAAAIERKKTQRET